MQPEAVEGVVASIGAHAYPADSPYLPVPLAGLTHHLVRTRLDIALARPALQRLHEASAGNPFFALELARTLDERALHEPLPISGELRQLLADRLAGLPKDTEQALLFAAAASQTTMELIEEAAGGGASLKPALDAELVELDEGRIRFAHPLLASVIYSEADADRKRAVHHRLAEVVADPEERARHLALSTDDPDAEVAEALDEAARIALRRGAPQAAAALSEQALRLTPPEDTEAAHRRRLEAGAAHLEAGDPAYANALFTEAAEVASTGLKRAEALNQLAWVDHYAGDQHVAVRLFRECLAEVGADSSLQADAAEGLASSLFFLREELPDALSHARLAAHAASEKEDDDPALAAALGTQGVIEAILGRREAVATLEAATDLEDWARSIRLVRRPSFESAFVGVWFDDFVLTHAGTLFSVFVAGIRKADLRPIAPYVVRIIEAELRSETLPPDTLGRLDPDAVRLAKTASRSILGFMNDMAVHLRYQVADAGGLGRCDIGALNHRLRRTLHNRGGYATPIELVAQQLGTRA